MSDRHQFWIVAGPNGSGKTTLTNRHMKRFASEIEIVNPDEIAKEIDPNFVDSPVVAMRAGINAIRLQDNCIKEKRTFLIETTYSGSRSLKLTKQAQDAGFKTNLVYVALEDPFDNITRVAERVSRGGHNIPAQDILRRYYRSLENAPLGLAIVDRAFVVDNSGKRHKMLFSLKKDLLHFVTPEAQCPKWAKGVLSALIVAKKDVYLSRIDDKDKRVFFSDACDLFDTQKTSSIKRLGQQKQLFDYIESLPVGRSLPSPKIFFKMIRDCGEDLGM